MIKLLAALFFLSLGAFIGWYGDKVFNADFSFDGFDLPDIEDVQP